jgi:hypothetical protein
VIAVRVAPRQRDLDRAAIELFGSLPINAIASGP